MHPERVICCTNSVCLSIRPSVQCQYCVNQNEWTHYSGRGIILVFEPYRHYKTHNLSSWALNVRGGKMLQILPFISKTVRDRPVVTTEHW